MRIAGTLPCSFVNGEGARFVIFVQGCAHHCEQCQNPDTWDFTGGQEISVFELAEIIRAEMQRHPLDGITLSGGDPYYQQDAVLNLLGLLGNIDCWIYTGFEWSDIEFDPITKRASRVVCGRFIEDQRCEGKMYGSSNQYIVDTRSGTVVG